MQNPNSAFRMHLDRLNALIRDGGTLSGLERNCAFLNTGGGRFAWISAVSGLDFVDDARSPAAVDWDGDGDLDLWIANRTSPQLRFLRNDTPTDANYLALQLQGQHCNRDAIGARVEVHMIGQDRLIKTLHAGEGFLSQSSKWLVFGLGGNSDIAKVTVRWPGGGVEEFSGLQVNARYHLVQGAAAARRDRAEERTVALAPSRLATQAPSAQTRIVLSARVPVPTLRYRDEQGQELTVPLGAGSPVLLNIWASWCAPCRDELSAWTRHSQQLQDAGLHVVALTVDDCDDNEQFTSASARSILTAIGFPFQHGAATEELRMRLEQVHRWPFLRNLAMPVPASFLFDGRGRLAVIYRGTAGVEQLQRDARLLPLDDDALLAAALPFPGRWRDTPRPLEPIQMAVQLMDRGDVADAAEFVNHHGELLRPSREYALLAAWLGDEFAKLGRMERAIGYYDEAIRRDPNNLTVMNNLAWHLATNPDAGVRNPHEAIRWAEAAAQATRGENAGVLDTLAAAYASSGQFQQAVRVARRAMILAKSSGQPELLENISARLLLYRRGEPFHQAAEVD